MKEIKTLVSQIEALTGNKYKIDFNSAYGGYRLLSSETYTFGKSDCCDRLSNKEFKHYLSGIIAGLKFEVKL